jgi:hypothetical protein
MKPLAIVGAVIGSLVLIAAIAIGGWQLNWWAQNSAVNHQAHIYSNSYGTQTADIQEARNLATQISQIDVQVTDSSTPASEVSALRSQRTAMVTQACSITYNIAPNLMPPDLSTFTSTNCH